MRLRRAAASCAGSAGRLARLAASSAASPPAAGAWGASSGAGANADATEASAAVASWCSSAASWSSAARWLAAASWACCSGSADGWAPATGPGSFTACAAAAGAGEGTAGRALGGAGAAGRAAEARASSWKRLLPARTRLPVVGQGVKSAGGGIGMEQEGPNTDQHGHALGGRRGAPGAAVLTCARRADCQSQLRNCKHHPANKKWLTNVHHDDVLSIILSGSIRRGQHGRGRRCRRCRRCRLGRWLRSRQRHRRRSWRGGGCCRFGGLRHREEACAPCRLLLCRLLLRALLHMLGLRLCQAQLPDESRLLCTTILCRRRLDCLRHCCRWHWLAAPLVLAAQADSVAQQCGRGGGVGWCRRAGCARQAEPRLLRGGGRRGRQQVHFGCSRGWAGWHCRQPLVRGVGAVGAWRLRQAVLHCGRAGAGRQESSGHHSGTGRDAHAQRQQNSSHSGSGIAARNAQRS